MEQQEIRVGMLFKPWRKYGGDRVDLITNLGDRSEEGVERWCGWRVFEWEGGRVLLDGGTAGPDVVEEYLGDWELEEALAAVDMRMSYYPRYDMPGADELRALDVELKEDLRENWGKGRMIQLDG